MSDAKSKITNLREGLLRARCISVVAELGIADLVAERPRSPADLAAACGAHSDRLMRVLRYLASEGIFAADTQGAIHNTEASELLRSGLPGSQRDLVRQAWQDIWWQAYGQIPHTVRTGTPAFNTAFGMDFFEYLAAHPEIGARFDTSMALMSAPENATIAAAYDFTGKVVVDVGGGRGGLLAAILNEHPSTHGVLFDQAHVLADRSRLAVAGMMDRCNLVAGNFFAFAPGGGDVYVLKRILHDWSDDKALEILKNVRAATSPTARILVIDAVIAPGNEPDPNKLLDIGIMALLNGGERTADEFHRLFAAAGFTLRAITPLAAPATLSLIEGERL